MSARRVVLAVVFAGGMVLALAGSASANLVWCMDDPPTQVQTPGGTSLMVNTQVSVPRDQVASLRAVQTSTTTASDGKGGTLVTVYTTLPAGITTASVQSSVNRYKVSASGTGRGGQTVTLYLDVPAA